MKAFFSFKNRSSFKTLLIDIFRQLLFEKKILCGNKTNKTLHVFKNNVRFMQFISNIYEFYKSIPIPNLKGIKNHFITAYKRCLGQGNVFAGVCQSCCPQGGGGVCLWVGGVPLGVCAHPLDTPRHRLSIK